MKYILEILGYMKSAVLLVLTYVLDQLAAIEKPDWIPRNVLKMFAYSLYLSIPTGIAAACSVWLSSGLVWATVSFWFSMIVYAGIYWVQFQIAYRHQENHE